MIDKKFKKVWDTMDDKTKEAIKFLINELTQKKYQKLADEAMQFQGMDKLTKKIKESGES